MKSLRKIVVLLCTLSVWMPSLVLQAQDSRQDATATKPAPPPQSQQPPQRSESQAKIISNPTLVVLPVTVKDKAGRLVADLHKDEFRVFEDKVEQTISVFTIEAFPLSMVVLVDNDLKQKDAEQVENSLRAIVAGMSANDEAFVCRFDQFFYEGKGFNTDQNKLLTELKRTKLDTEPSVPPTSGPFNGPTINNQPAPGAPNNPGSTRAIKGQPTKALDDAVYNAAQLLKDRGRERRKIIVLISDGQNGRKFNTNTYDNTVKELLRYGISVYSVATGSAYFDRKFSRLIDYAHDSGGDVYFGAKSSTFEELYSRVTEEARNQYTLAYAPHGTNRGDDYHTIEVRVKREGLTILTREGYYTGALSVAPSK
jgi:Ca-activated chloride channel family protein